jgi:glycerol kinase
MDFPATVNAIWQADASFSPSMDAATRDRLLSDWHRAVERSRDWDRSPA